MVAELCRAQATHKEDYAQFISAVFGELPAIDGAHLGNEGKLKENANSWAKQSQTYFDFIKEEAVNLRRCFMKNAKARCSPQCFPIARGLQNSGQTGSEQSSGRGRCRRRASTYYRTSANLKSKHSRSMKLRTCLLVQR